MGIRRFSYHVHDGEVYVFFADGYDSPCFYEVEPSTVGQYTGITDKNGVKIFDGDMVRINGDDIGAWKGADHNAMIAFLDGGFCAIDENVRIYSLSRVDFDIEVIGNIHDNPKLLEEENE